MLEVFEHALIDSVKLIPFLFITYLIMEYLEHKTSDKAKEIIKKSGKFGPLIGSFLGIFPQCGFSASATNLYAGRVITLGTLIAVYLSTSDEMLPIFISESVPINIILKILVIKFIIGIIAGFIIDLYMNKTRKNEEQNISEICEHEHCHCKENNIFKSALGHTINIFIYIFIITVVINLVIHLIGEERLSEIILNQPILGPVIAAIIGLIPNCASSVIITNLYLQNIINVSTLIAGLLTNAGVGIIVLFRMNKNAKENVKIVALLYFIGVISGILLETIGLNI